MTAVMEVDGAALTVRPIEVSDVEALERMFGELSPESIYFRFFSPLHQVARSTVARMSDVDHCRRDALVALDGDEIVAIASYDAPMSATSREAELAAVVGDAWQGRGVGLRLTRRLIELALDRGYQTLFATTLPGNRAALALLRKLSPHSVSRFVSGAYEVRLAIDDFEPRRARGRNACLPDSTGDTP